MDKEFSNLFIDVEVTNKDIDIIKIKELNELNKQKCRDYVNDHPLGANLQFDQKDDTDPENEYYLSLQIDDKNNSGIFYIKNEVDILDIKTTIILIKKLTNFLNRNNIQWEGYKTGFEMRKHYTNFYRLMGLAFIIVTKSQCILVYSDGEDNVIENKFSLMDKII